MHHPQEQSELPWDRFNDLLTRHPLPAARIVHRHTAVSESPVKNRMLEIGTSGTVRGEDGNILTPSAPEATAFRRWSVHTGLLGSRESNAAIVILSELCQRQGDVKTQALMSFALSAAIRCVTIVSALR